MIKINALGKPCPIPVIETKKAIRKLDGKADTIEVTVDNEVAINNIYKMTQDLGIATQTAQQADDHFTITLQPTGKLKEDSSIKEDIVIMIGTQTYGKGDDKLGTMLMKSYLYSLTELDDLPTTLIFFNEGAFLTDKTSPVLEDLQTLQDKGVTILTCGTCVDFYEIKDTHEIGDITNMFSISEIQMKADNVVTL